MQSLQQEVSKVEQNRAHIQHLAHHDPLTNLPNRILGERLFNEKLRESEEKGLQLALLFIDLDNFKPGMTLLVMLRAIGFFKKYLKPSPTTYPQSKV